MRIFTLETQARRVVDCDSLQPWRGQQQARQYWKNRSKPGGIGKFNSSGEMSSCPARQRLIAQKQSNRYLDMPDWWPCDSITTLGFVKPSQQSTRQDSRHTRGWACATRNMEDMPRSTPSAHNDGDRIANSYTVTATPSPSIFVVLLAGQLRHDVT